MNRKCRRRRASPRTKKLRSRLLATITAFLNWQRTSNASSPQCRILLTLRPVHAFHPLRLLLLRDIRKSNLIWSVSRLLSSTVWKAQWTRLATQLAATKLRECLQRQLPGQLPPIVHESVLQRQRDCIHQSEIRSSRHFKRWQIRTTEHDFQAITWLCSWPRTISERAIFRTAERLARAGKVHKDKMAQVQSLPSKHCFFPRRSWWACLARRRRCLWRRRIRRWTSKISLSLTKLRATLWRTSICLLESLDRPRRCLPRARFLRQWQPRTRESTKLWALPEVQEAHRKDYSESRAKSSEAVRWSRICLVLFRSVNPNRSIRWIISTKLSQSKHRLPPLTDSYPA